jgi:hypothetical protein
VDESDPPLYESEAVYLRRHGLLTATEKRWLQDHPEALEPVTIEHRAETGPEVRPLFSNEKSYYVENTNV